MPRAADRHQPCAGANGELQRDVPLGYVPHTTIKDLLHVHHVQLTCLGDRPVSLVAV